MEFRKNQKNKKLIYWYVEKFKTLRFFLSNSEKVLGKTHVKRLYFISQRHCYDLTTILNISHVKPINWSYNWVYTPYIIPTQWFDPKNMLQTGWYHWLLQKGDSRDKPVTNRGLPFFIFFFVIRWTNCREYIFIFNNLLLPILLLYYYPKKMI